MLRRQTLEQHSERDIQHARTQLDAMACRLISTVASSSEPGDRCSSTPQTLQRVASDILHSRRFQLHFCVLPNVALTRMHAVLARGVGSRYCHASAHLSVDFAFRCASCSSRSAAPSTHPILPYAERRGTYTGTLVRRMHCESDRRIVQRSLARCTRLSGPLVCVCAVRSDEYTARWHSRCACASSPCRCCRSSYCSCAPACSAHCGGCRDGRQGLTIPGTGREQGSRSHSD